MKGNPISEQEMGFRVSKKSSECWAFSIIHDIMVMGEEKCYKVEKWSEACLKLWTPIHPTY
jgi:hypothetical protein